MDWPGHVAPNSTSDARIPSGDYHPTRLDVAGATGKAGQVVDGVDIRPVLEGESASKRDTIFCRCPHGIPATDGPAAVYVIAGDWKLNGKLTLMKYGQDKPVWQIDPTLGKLVDARILRVKNPKLEPHSRYHILRDANLVRVKMPNGTRPLPPLANGPFAYRFNTGAQ